MRVNEHPVCRTLAITLLSGTASTAYADIASSTLRFAGDWSTPLSVTAYSEATTSSGTDSQIQWLVPPTTSTTAASSGFFGESASSNGTVGAINPIASSNAAATIPAAGTAYGYTNLWGTFISSVDQEVTLTLEINWNNNPSGRSVFGVGFWDGLVFGDNLLITPQLGFDEFDLTDLGFDDGRLLLNEVTGSGGYSVPWTLTLEAGKAYTFYTHVLTDPDSSVDYGPLLTVPAPASVLVLGCTLPLARRRR